jgi:hypothetical protein
MIKTKYLRVSKITAAHQLNPKLQIGKTRPKVQIEKIRPKNKLKRRGNLTNVSPPPYLSYIYIYRERERE